MYRDDGKENGSYYVVYWGHRKTELLAVCWVLRSYGPIAAAVVVAAVAATSCSNVIITTSIIITF